jgi:hypothetical protein
MSTQLVPIEISGRTVYFELADAPPKADEISNTSAKSTDLGLVRRAVEPLESADLHATLDALLEPVRQASDGKKLEEVSVELSLGIKAEVGFFVAKGETNASLKVTAKWRPVA